VKGRSRRLEPRDGTGSPDHGSPGHRVSDFVGVGSRVSVSDPVFDRFWVLICAFIVALFLQSNTISASRGFGFGHSTTGLLISVRARNIYLFTCWLSLWRHDVSGFDVIWATDRVGSGRVTGSKILTQFHLCRRRSMKNQPAELQYRPTGSWDGHRWVWLIGADREQNSRLPRRRRFWSTTHRRCLHLEHYPPRHRQPVKNVANNRGDVVELSSSVRHHLETARVTCRNAVYIGLFIFIHHRSSWKSNNNR